MRRIGVLHDYAEGDPEGQAQITAFRQELQKLGWMDGGNAQIEYRAGAADADSVRTYAAALIAHGPDVVLGAGGTIVAALQRASRTVPIVFVNVTDPVGGGLVASLARPVRNATGFTQFEFGISAKWLELLKQIAPGLTRVAVIRDPTARSGGGQLGAIQASAPAFGVEVLPIDPQDAETIETRSNGIFGGYENRPDRHVEQTGTSPPATDRIAGGPQSLACDLRIPRLRCGGRIKLLRA
jgi:putative ABC transport system substrate-binding protein